MELTNIKEIKSLLEKYDFSFSKALGQNFIINPGICPRMAREGGATPGVMALEIGPGIGTLTKELAKTADKVVAVEIDDRLPPILAETLAEFDNVKIISGDALKIDLSEIIKTEAEGRDTILCANLPYYITSPVILRVLESRLPVKSLTAMVQKEAAARLCAEPGSREVGAVSVAVRYYSNPKILFHVSAGSFLPKPDVDSAVIRLDILAKPPVKVEDEAFFFETVKALFSQRRKQIVNCLCGYFRLEKSAVTDALVGLGIAPSRRAEALSMAEFAAIAEGMRGLAQGGCGTL